MFNFNSSVKRKPLPQETMSMFIAKSISAVPLERTPKIATNLN